MSKESFTPGDWIYVVRRDGSILISIGNRTTGPHYQWDWIATEADARLATAAPDLLAALEAAIECRMVPISSAKDGGGNKYSQQVAVADQIRDAIAKARGETA